MVITIGFDQDIITGINLNSTYYDSTADWELGRNAATSYNKSRIIAILIATSYNNSYDHSYNHIYKL